MKLAFYKYQGTGNDFIIIDNRTNTIALTAEQIRYLCNRHFGIGADGLMLLNTKEHFDFEMKYYNADGNESTLCGNGGRCITLFAKRHGTDKKSYNFIAADGAHESTIEDDNTIRLKNERCTKPYHKI